MFRIERRDVPQNREVVMGKTPSATALTLSRLPDLCRGLRTLGAECRERRVGLRAIAQGPEPKELVEKPLLGITKSLHRLAKNVRLGRGASGITWSLSSAVTPIFSAMRILSTCRLISRCVALTGS